MQIPVRCTGTVMCAIGFALARAFKLLPWHNLTVTKKITGVASHSLDVEKACTLLQCYENSAWPTSSFVCALYSLDYRVAFKVWPGLHVPQRSLQQGVGWAPLVPVTCKSPTNGITATIITISSNSRSSSDKQAHLIIDNTVCTFSIHTDLPRTGMPSLAQF